jgi:MFS family permease
MAVVAVMATTAGSLPVFLIAGLAVQVRETLGFSEWQLGAVVTAYFAVSAVSSTPAGHVVERIGTYRSLLAAMGISSVALAGVGLLTDSWGALLLFVGLSGFANGLGQPASNLLLARGIAPGRQGLAFGVKQSAVPAASLLGGLAVPALGLTVGWRWAFLGAVLWPVVTSLLTPRLDSAPSRRRGRLREGDAGLRVLIALTAVAGLATATATGLAAFIVEWGVAAGMSPARAGLLLASGSAAAVAIRVLTGWRADRSSVNPLLLVSGMLAAGLAGLALLMTGRPVLLFAGALLGLGCGWGWNGLLVYAVVRLNPRAPAAATGVSQTGLYLGGMIGPMIFGVLVQQRSYTAALAVGMVLMLVGAGLALAVARLTSSGAAGARRAVSP